MESKHLPLVSILVPVYCVEDFIEQCARSILGQTYQNLEFVFVDDCTPDNSIKILETVIADFPKCKNAVKIIHHEKRRGVAATRNTAIDKCSGEFLLFVDSDDWIDLNAVELLVIRQLEKGADIVTADAYDFDGNIEYPHVSGGNNLDREEAINAFLSNKLSHSVWRRLIRKSLYTNNSIQCIENVNMSEDFQVIPKLFYYSKTVSGIPDYIYHKRTNNKSSYVNQFGKGDWELMRQSLISFEEVYKFFSDKGVCFQMIMEKTLLHKYYRTLLLTYRFHNHKGFNFCRNFLLKLKPELLREIRWNNKLVRLFESNYYLMLLSYPIRTYRGNLLEIIRNH